MALWFTIALAPASALALRVSVRVRVRGSVSVSVSVSDSVRGRGRGRVRVTVRVAVRVRGGAFMSSQSITECDGMRDYIYTISLCSTFSMPHYGPPSLFLTVVHLVYSSLCSTFDMPPAMGDCPGSLPTVRRVPTTSLLSAFLA